MELIYLTTPALQQIGADLVIKYLKEAEEAFQESGKIKKPSNGVIYNLHEVNREIVTRKGNPALFLAYDMKKTSWYCYITALRKHVNEILYTYFPEPAINGQFHPLLNYLNQEWLEFCYLYLCWTPESDENKED